QVIWQARRRNYRKLIHHRMVPIQYRDYGQLTLTPFFQPIFTINHVRQFTNRQSMDHCNLMKRHPRLKLIILAYWAVYLITTRIWAIEYDEVLPMLGAQLHHAVQGCNVGVKTCSHILQVKYHHIDRLYDGVLLFVSSIKRIQRQPSLRIRLITDFLAPLYFSSKTMLRRKRKFSVHTFF